MYPQIKDKVRVVWLGGSPPGGKMREFNASDGWAAVKTVFESSVQLAVVPTQTSARHLVLPYEEADKRLRHTNRLGETLRVLLRDYGLRRMKVNRDQADLATSKWPKNSRPAAILPPVGTFGPGSHKIRVCGMPSRDAIFADFFRNFPQPKDAAETYLLSALATGYLRQVRLLFSEPVGPRTAGDPKCYSASAAAVSAEPSGATVTSSLEHPVAVGAEIAATCVRDAAGNAMLPTGNRVPVHTEARATSGIRLRAYRAAKALDRVLASSGAAFVDEIIPGLDWV